MTSKRPVSLSTNDSNGETRSKKPRIDIALLGSIGASRRMYVGELRNLAFKKPVVKKEFKNIFIEAVVVEFKYGRLVSNSETRSPFAFVVIADATGVVTIGSQMNRSGLDKFMIHPDDITDDSRCFFVTRITGTIKIVPKRGDSFVPLLSLWGKFSSLASSATHNPRDKLVSLVYPTGDVLDQICDDEYAESSKYTTPLIAGKVDTLLLQEESQKLFISMQDSTGPFLLELNNLPDGQQFVENMKLTTDSPVVATGELHISRKQLGGMAYPCVQLDFSQENSHLSLLSLDDFKAYNDTLYSLPNLCFSGVEPTSS